MKIKEAVNRIYWRFGGNNNPKPFPINQGDLEAYNAIKNFVAEKEKEQFINQELFAKLFIYLYMKVLEQDKETLFDKTDQNGNPVANTSRRKIYNLLKKDLSTIIQEFTDSLNASEQYELLESVQGEIKHPAALSDQERVSYSVRLKEALKTPENASKLLGEVWEYDLVASALESEVNQAIELFKN